jgi:hypothetical protein
MRVVGTVKLTSNWFNRHHAKAGNREPALVVLDESQHKVRTSGDRKAAPFVHNQIGKPWCFCSDSTFETEGRTVSLRGRQFEAK